MKKYLLFIPLFSITQLVCFDIRLQTNRVSETVQKLDILVTLDKNELLYADLTDISIDSPYYQLSDWRYDTNPVDKYDAIYKETRKVFEKKVHIFLQVTQRQETSDRPHLYVTYQTNRQNSPQQKVFFIPKNGSTESFEATHGNEKKETEGSSTQCPAKKEESSPLAPASMTLAAHIKHYYSTISTLAQQTRSVPLLLILVFFLGIFLSLTPCIYPMIPITIGILQAQKSNSFMRNFFHACAYTIGLSTTFSLLGIAASFFGPVYGRFLANPFFVIVLALLLAYLGLSMFGFYDIALPTWLSLGHRVKNSASLFSSFLFGAASGTIASPCVSPGLIVLLSIVAKLNNMFLGFLLLFSFGTGLSAPLLVVGTFSHTMTMLPSAGMWMVEVKKILGIMTFGVCFYYLSAILPFHYLLYIISVFLFLLGTYYFYTTRLHRSKTIERYSNVVGTVSIIVSIIVLGFGFKQQFMSSLSSQQQLCWLTDYQQALQKARCEKKLLFLDFWTDYCSVCKAIHKHVLQDPYVQETLKNMVTVSINETDAHDAAYQTLQKQFHIVGFPTLLVVEPNQEVILEQWHSELYQTPKQEFIEKLSNHISGTTQ